MSLLPRQVVRLAVVVAEPLVAQTVVAAVRAAAQAKVFSRDPAAVPVVPRAVLQAEQVALTVAAESQVVPVDPPVAPATSALLSPVLDCLPAQAAYPRSVVVECPVAVVLRVAADCQMPVALADCLLQAAAHRVLMARAVKQVAAES
ncbi:MAG: hypothetical protein ABW106_12775 [Steroidobacteraceae bacterium]